MLIAKRGSLELTVDTTQGPISHTLVGTATSWDTFSVPQDCWRTLRNTGEDEVLALVMTAGDHRKRIVWSDAVVAAAARADLTHDASGFVAPKNFVDRAQR